MRPAGPINMPERDRLGRMVDVSDLTDWARRAQHRGMRRTFATLILVLFGCGAASECLSPDRLEERNELLSTLSAAPTEPTGQEAANAVWAFWLKAPDARSQALLNMGMGARSLTDLERSEVLLTELTEYCPSYAEGWNQRAFTRFLLNDFKGSLEDIAVALDLEPAHFGALSGQAQIYLRQGRGGLAQIALRRAVRVHPWLAERAILEQNPGETL